MKRTFKKPSFYLISSATDGDAKAIEKILAIYDPYISKCCLRPFYDKYGNVCIVVDMELKGRIREALIKILIINLLEFKTRRGREHWDSKKLNHKYCYMYILMDNLADVLNVLN